MPIVFSSLKAKVYLNTGFQLESASAKRWISRCTHNLADFLSPVYLKIKSEVMNAKVFHVDETPHRMLEGMRSRIGICGVFPQRGQVDTDN